MLAATTDELERRFRSDVKDIKTAADGSDFGCLWTDADVYGYMTVACDALAKLTQGLYKTLQLQIAANNAWVKLPSYVQHIREAHLLSNNARVEQVDAADVDYAPASGAPQLYVRDYDRRSLRLLPTPTIPDTLEIQAAVSIALPMEAGLPVPFTDTEDQQLLLEKMKALAYLKHDAETEDLTRARVHADLYAQGALSRMSLLGNLRRTPPVMRMTD